MEFKNYIYIVSLAVVLILFLVLSIGWVRVPWKKMKYIFPSILITETLFIMFGARLAELKIIIFNDDHLINSSFMGLPAEEWLYYLIIPLFIFWVYELAKAKTSHLRPQNYYVVLSLVLLLAFIAIAYFSRRQVYTSLVFLFLSAYFGYIIFRNLFKAHYPAFYISFLISFIPYFLLDLLFTGLPVVEYNTAYMLNLKLFSVPVENIGGFFLLCLMNITIYEYLTERRFF